MRIAIWLVLAVGCGGGGEGGSLTSGAITAEQAAPLCMAACQHDLDCGDATELATCTSNCQDDFVGWARGDAIETFLECVTEQVCTASEGDCIRLVQPLAIHEEWEAACRANLGACPDFEPDLACEVSPDPNDEDIGLFRFIAPELMTGIIACLDGSDCQTQIDCVGGELESNGIDF